MAAVSVTALANGARWYADERPSGATAYLPDTDPVEGVVRRSVAKVRNEIILARGHELFLSTSTFSTSATSESYSLPADHEQTIRLTVDWGSEREDIPAAEHREHAALINMDSWTQGAAKGYRVRESTLLLEPTPDAATTVRHLYLQRIDTTASQYDLRIDGWDEWVMLDTAAALLMIQGKPTGMLIARRDEVGEQITRMAQDRSAMDPTRIVDVQPRAFEPRWWPGR